MRKANVATIREVLSVAFSSCNCDEFLPGSTQPYCCCDLASGCPYSMLLLYFCAVVPSVKRLLYYLYHSFVTGLFNGPVLFCLRTSIIVICYRRLSSSVTLLAGGWPVGCHRARRMGGLAANTAWRSSTVTSR